MATTPWNTEMAALPGLWAWWKLDEVASVSGSAADASGNGRAGTYTAVGTHGATGLFAGSSASQTTLGGRVNLPVFPLAASPIFSVGAVVISDAVASLQSVLSADRATAPRAWQFRKNTTHGMEFVAVNTGTVLASPTSINDGQPHLVIAVYDQTLAAGSGRIKIYLDGSLSASSTVASVVNGSISAQPAIGSRGSAAANEPWGGAMDECFLVDGALTSGQISALWATRNTP